MTKEEALEFIGQSIKPDVDMAKVADAIKALEQESNGDLISRGVFEQVMWERDVAIEQLEELGYSLGEKPKIGHWIEGKYRDDDIRYNDSSYKCDKCGRIVDFKENFCPDCGARMVEPQESEDEE